MATVLPRAARGVGGFQRFVAIKRLHPHLANEPEFVEMFLDEARLAAGIHHPNVVPILEVGQNEAGYYLVMEYIEGDTLSRIVARAMPRAKCEVPRHVVAAHRARRARTACTRRTSCRRDGRSSASCTATVAAEHPRRRRRQLARITDFGVARASSRLANTARTP
jgi:serine/threonine protein kinase